MRNFGLWLVAFAWIQGFLLACSGQKSTDGGNIDAGMADGRDAGALDSGSAPLACDVAPVQIIHDGGLVEVQPSLQVLDTARYPDALCNDGTPAIYAIRSGYGGGAKRWLISLEGGGSCVDASSCYARRTATTKAVGYILTTSDAGMAGVPSRGIDGYDPAYNEDFYDANEVRIHYCSSDDWEGTHVAQGAFSAEDPGTWNFLGHAIVRAVVQDLIALHGMAGAEEVILEGESAGGAGVFYNANAVASQLPPGARFVAISDAALAINVPGFDSSQADGVSVAAPPYPLEVKQQAALALWNGTGDPSCLAAPDGGQISCSDPTVLLASHAFRMPVFVRQSEEDAQKMPDLNAPDPASAAANTAPAAAYFSFYEAQQRSAMRAVPAPYSVFGDNITDHIDLLGGAPGTPLTFSAPVFPFPNGDSLSIEDAIHVWYADPCTQHLWVQ